MNEPPVYDVWKVCRGCQAEWKGKSFHAPGETAVSSLCADCIAKQEARVKQLASKPTTTIDPDLELAPPMETHEDQPIRPAEPIIGCLTPQLRRLLPGESHD